MTARPLAETLAGRHVLLTGATGFVGEALLARLLTDIPGARVSVIARRKGPSSGADRVRQLLRGAAFDRVRDRAGGDLAPLVGSEHLRVLEGDLANVPALPDDLDVVIHCAGEVSFDPAIDEGFATNLHGTLALLAAIDASGSRPHYLHVSTAYVAGRREGHVLEGRLDHDVDWQVEAAAAARLRPRAEDASREPEALARFLSEAERDLRGEGPSAVAADSERRRRAWVDRQLVDAGRERARTLGWTDCYTFTKAMAERAVEQTASHLPVTVMRPSIIESALRTPFPGWIQGFKMAEPLILAYARGDLPEFPGIPDGVIDIIPIDLVVNATLAAAARPPQPGEPAYFTICSGARNPLTYSRLYELVRDYFSRHPLVEPDRGAIPVTVWSWPGSTRVESLLRLGERAHRHADRAVAALPRSRRTREWARSLDRQQRRLEFLRRYFDLYRPYVVAELRYLDRATLALNDDLDPSDRESWGFDAAVIDWDRYLLDTHVPTVVEPVRAFTAGRRRRPAPVRRLTPGTDVVAVFDMDGTLLPSNVVESYLWLRLPELGGLARAREIADVARALPGWLLTQRRSRADFLRSVYRRYEGASPEGLNRIVDERVAPVMLRQLSAAASRAIREHRRLGHRVVLVTGAVEALTRPLQPLFDEVVAARLAVGSDGRFTGHLLEPPLVGESRAAWLRHRAAESGWELTRSYAYADSASDLPLLRAVGRPVAVDPDVVLSRVAHRNRWPVEEWHAGTPATAELVTTS